MKGREEHKMRTQESNQLIENTAAADSALVSGVYSSTVSYHELAEIPVQKVDVLEQLQENLLQLEDLQARLRFMMSEIRYVLKV